MEAAMRLGDARLPASFWSKVEIDNARGCWTWTGYRTTRGYGRIAGKPTHQVAYVAAFGKHEDGLELDHLCEQKSCCNPAHLEAVTHAVNVARGGLGRANSLRHINRVACVRGHDYATHGTRTANGRRRCVACANLLGNERAKAKRRAAGHMSRKRKITLATAREIHERLKRGEGPSAISRIYNVSAATISNIKSGKTWSHAREV
jgi:hypothetical protein